MCLESEEALQVISASIPDKIPEWHSGPPVAIPANYVGAYREQLPGTSNMVCHRNLSIRLSLIRAEKAKEHSIIR